MILMELQNLKPNVNQMKWRYGVFIKNNKYEFISFIKEKNKD